MFTSYQTLLLLVLLTCLSLKVPAKPMSQENTEIDLPKIRQ